MEKRQQSIPKKEIECLKRKFATSEKNSSEKHLTTEGLGLQSLQAVMIKNQKFKKHFEDNESSDDSVDGENSVCIDRVESAVIQTSVRINDYELKAVIDTGAEVTVLSEKVYRNLAREHHLELKTATTRGMLVAEEGKKMSATGITDIEMSLGPLRFTWPVYVAPLNDDLLLGCDIIDEMDITVNTKRGFQIKDIWYPCEVKRRENKVLRIVLNKNISIKSQSEMIIQIPVPDPEIFKIHEDKTDDWTEFHDKIDNIKDIGRTTNESIRAVTRSSTKQAIKPANWLQKYTASEMKELQRKDNDIGPLFTWKESKEPTTREQIEDENDQPTFNCRKCRDEMKSLKEAIWHGTEDLAINCPEIVIDVQEEVVEIITKTKTQIKTTDAETQTDKMEDFEKQLKDQRKEVLKLREEETFGRQRSLP
ncbi:Hypothetical predicted protein [Mytilus galloprovincialis]|uniref:Peptidase A2 domain-containing protein n=1 Tax=Mytilus galloprovincialis TaxID=29158 RepID=A0A8B6DXY9_MYTGA|nr:Hypothetical predicted protein [Mytilus galloprovincialis]